MSTRRIVRLDELESSLQGFEEIRRQREEKKAKADAEDRRLEEEHAKALKLRDELIAMGEIKTHKSIGTELTIEQVKAFYESITFLKEKYGWKRLPKDMFLRMVHRLLRERLFYIDHYLEEYYGDEQKEQHTIRSNAYTKRKGDNNLQTNIADEDEDW